MLKNIVICNSLKLQGTVTITLPLTNTAIQTWPSQAKHQRHKACTNPPSFSGVIFQSLFEGGAWGAKHTGSATTATDITDYVISETSTRELALTPAQPLSPLVKTGTAEAAAIKLPVGHQHPHSAPKN